MESITITVDDRTLSKMRKFYDSQMILIDDSDVLFKAQIIGCTITAKVSRDVIFEGIRAEDAMRRWHKPLHTGAPAQGEPYLKRHIGSDDVGHNDYFGPICTVACYVDDDDIPWLSKFNLSDVKSLPAAEIIRIAREIKDRIIYSLLILDNPHYNKMINEGINAAHIKAKLHNQAITNVMQRLEYPVETKVVEYFVAPKTYYNYLKNEVIVVKNLMFEKNSYGQYVAVACAQVLARYASLQYFNNMSRSLKVKLPHGTNALVDQIAIELVKTRGEGILNKVAKKNLPNTKRIMGSLNQSV